MNRKFGKNDILLLSAIAVAAGICFLCFHFWTKTGDTLLIMVDGQEYGTYALQDNRRIQIEKDGQVTNTVLIDDGTARMLDAACPDKLCVHQKAIAKDKESIICLPNQVVLTVKSRQESKLDSVAR